MEGLIIVLILLGLFVGIPVIAGMAANKPYRQYLALSANGRPARGIVLASSSAWSSFTYQGQPYERYPVTLDVEPENGASYEVSLTVVVPRGLVRMLPGEALELRIGRAQDAIAVIGPGGFTGPWLRMPTFFLRQCP
jgi:hypothetical protein